MSYTKDGKRYCDFCHGAKHLYPCVAQEKAVEAMLKKYPHLRR